MKRKLRVLVVVPSLPRPDTAAGDRRLYAILSIIARRHHVDIVPLCGVLPTDGRYVKQLKEVDVCSLHEHWDAFSAAIATWKYDVIFFEFFHTAEGRIKKLRLIQPWAGVLVDSVDVHFVRQEAGLGFGISDAATVAANKQRELDVYSQADAVLAVTKEDCAALKACENIPRQFIVPTILPQRVRPPGERQHDLLFVGGFYHMPNIDGIIWFTKEIWPLVKRDVPDAKVMVVGSNAPPEVLELGQIEGIEVVGYVPDTGPYMDRAAISIAPLRFGAGMKGKVTEAMVSGLPVVTTSVGAQGLGAVSGQYLMVADSPAEFAQAIIYLLNHPRHAEEIAKAARLLVEKLCGPKIVAEAIDEAIEFVAHDVIHPKPSRIKIPLKPIFYGYYQLRRLTRSFAAKLGLLKLRSLLKTK